MGGAGNYQTEDHKTKVLIAVFILMAKTSIIQELNIFFKAYSEESVSQKQIMVISSCSILCFNRLISCSITECITCNRN